MAINIEGLDKVELLRILWLNMVPASVALYAAILNNNTSESVFDKELAKYAVLGYIDYFQGRCIKSDLSGNEVDPFLYDRDAGKGVFQRIVTALRN